MDIKARRLRLIFNSNIYSLRNIVQQKRGIRNASKMNIEILKTIEEDIYPLINSLNLKEISENIELVCLLSENQLKMIEDINQKLYLSPKSIYFAAMLIHLFKTPPEQEKY